MWNMCAFILDCTDVFTPIGTTQPDNSGITRIFIRHGLTFYDTVQSKLLPTIDVLLLIGTGIVGRSKIVVSEDQNMLLMRLGERCSGGFYVSTESQLLQTAGSCTHRI